MNVVQVLNGLAFGSLLMILSSGLALILGLRGVTNFAHGSLYMAGGYVAYSVAQHVNFVAALVAAPIAVALIGAVMELVFFRRLEGRDHIEVGLVTFGLALAITRVILIVWGQDTHSVTPPAALDGTTTVGGISYPTYRLFIIGVAIVLALALVLWIQRTTIGLYIRAASTDLETAGILGINVDRVSLTVVCVGAALAGLGGALAAPFVSVSPTMGDSILITVLIVVIIGGAGSMAGAMISGLVLGLIQTFGNVWVPSVSVLAPYAALVVVLLVKPEGLAGKAAR